MVLKCIKVKCLTHQLFLLKSASVWQWQWAMLNILLFDSLKESWMVMMSWNVMFI